MVNLVSPITEWPYVTSLLQSCDKKCIASPYKNHLPKMNVLWASNYTHPDVGSSPVEVGKQERNPRSGFCTARELSKNGFHFFKWLQKTQRKIFHDTWKLCEIHISAHKGLLDCRHALLFILSVAAFMLRWQNTNEITCYSPQNDFIFSFIRL